MEVYLDNSATTRCYEAVRDIVCKVMCEDYGNPSSMHQKGLDAEQYVREGKTAIAHLLKVQEKEIIFTGGGTESDNLAVIGAAKANRRAGMHLITSTIEHPAVLKAMQHLEEEGFRVTYLPVDERGEVILSALEEALCPETILVSLMHVNNEIGTKQPIEEAATLVKRYNKAILVHVDAVQSFGKYRIYPGKAGIDLLSVSGHKIHGPKGTGALYIRDKVKIAPIVYGGGQQRDIRSGTENVPGIAGLSAAAKEIYEHLDVKTERMYALRERLKNGIASIEETAVHGGTGDKAAPHILSIGFAGIKSEVLLHTLEEKGIYVSSGSACAANHPAVSGVLRAIHAKKEYLDATIRFSLSEFTTEAEIDYTLEQLQQCVPLLRKYRRH